MDVHKDGEDLAVTAALIIVAAIFMFLISRFGGKRTAYFTGCALWLLFVGGISLFVSLVVIISI